MRLEVLPGGELEFWPILCQPSRAFTAKLAANNIMAAIQLSLAVLA